jgi:manganese transport system substrate-binding protein
MTSWQRTRLALVTVITAAILTACTTGTATSDRPAQDKPVVLTTFTVLEDIAQNVAGEHLTVESITKPGAEIHDYEPTPGDIRTASDAVLVLDNGLGLERWFEQFIHDADVPHVVVSEGITPIDISEDAYAGKPNPHAWMSPRNVQIYVDNIVSAFTELDPANADDYERNGEAYKQELQEVEDTLADELAQLPVNHRALITCEGAFSYLARDAGLTEQYLWPVNADEEGTPQQIAEVTDFVTEHDVPAVFCESTVSDKAMQQVAEATGAVLGDTLYVDSLSDADGPVPTYLDLIRHDVEAITAGLSGVTA